MRKEWRAIRGVIKKADLVLEVVDARDPWGTRCLKLEKMVDSMKKPLIIVINKADLVPREVMEQWKNVIGRFRPTIFIGARERLGTRKLWIAIKQHSSKRPVSVAVVGYPNVGKSTIINVLRGRHSVGTSPKPGFTRSPKTVRAAAWLKVVDTPGVVPVEEKDELSLVMKSGLAPEDLDDPVPVTVRFIRLALDKNPRIFERTYGVKGDNPVELLEKIASRFGFITKGGKLNLEEAARKILRDWQQGKLVFYFTPKDYGLNG